MCQQLQRLTLITALSIPTTAAAEIPDELAALAGLCSANYYASHISFHAKFAEAIPVNVKQLVNSNNEELASAGLDIGAARRALFECDAAIQAAESGTPIETAIRSMETRWALDPAAQHDFSSDIFDGSSAKCGNSKNLFRYMTGEVCHENTWT